MALRLLKFADSTIKPAKPSLISPNFRSLSQYRYLYCGEDGGALKRFGTDLTEQAKNGELDPVIGSDGQIRQCVQILSMATRNNPLLIGEPSVGKTAIVQGIAQRIASGEVPFPLLDQKVISLNLSSLVAGTMSVGKLENKVETILKEISDVDGKIILFIDDIHSIIGGDKMDIATILKLALGKGKLRCIGSTTLKEYGKYIKKDTALERKFQKVSCDPPSVEDTISILRGLRKHYESHHRVRLLDKALVSAAVLADRYIVEGVLPDKAIDLVDEAAAKRKMEFFWPMKMAEIDRDVFKLEMEIQSLKADSVKDCRNRLGKLECNLHVLGKKREELMAKWQPEKAIVNRGFSTSLEIGRVKKYIDAVKPDDKVKCEALNQSLQSLEKKLEVDMKCFAELQSSGNCSLRLRVSERDIQEAVAERTGIPLSNISQSDMEKLVRIEEVLRQRVIGQDVAIKSVADAIRRSRAGLSEPKRPMASFMFMGPSGVGKTELANALANYLFGTEKALVRIDMSEYMKRSAVSRLTDAASHGLDGPEEGQLTEPVLRRPYSVILFDKIDKAHNDVIRILLQLLSDGSVTDSSGKIVSFKNCVVIMTSNIGSQEILRSTNNKETSYDTMKRQTMDLARETFNPEFVDHVDELVVFQSPNAEEVGKIVEMQMNCLKERLEGRKIIHLGYTREAVNLMVSLFDPKIGVGSVKRVIKQMVEYEIAMRIVEGDFKKEDSIVVDADMSPSATDLPSNRRFLIKKVC